MANKLLDLKHALVARSRGYVVTPDDRKLGATCAGGHIVVQRVSG